MYQGFGMNHFTRGKYHVYFHRGSNHCITHRSRTRLPIWWKTLNLYFRKDYDYESYYSISYDVGNSDYHYGVLQHQLNKNKCYRVYNYPMAFIFVYFYVFFC